MAEAVAILGTACNILQLIDTSFKLASEIKDFIDVNQELPQILEEVVCHVSTIRAPLRRLGFCAISKEGEMRDFLVQFNKTINQLKKKLEKVAPHSKDSTTRRAKKALIHHFKVEKDIQAALGRLKGYEGLMTLYLTTCVVSSGTMYSIISRRGAFTFKLYWFQDWAVDFETKAMASCIETAKVTGGLGGELIYYDSANAENSLAYLGEMMSFSMYNSKQKEVVIYLRFWDYTIDSSLRKVLDDLEVPYSELDDFASRWGILKQVLEEWQKPWILFLYFYDRKGTPDGFHYVAKTLPRSMYGTVMVGFLARDSAECVSTLTTHNPQAVDPYADDRFRPLRRIIEEEKERRRREREEKEKEWRRNNPRLTELPDSDSDYYSDVEPFEYFDYDYDSDVVLDIETLFESPETEVAENAEVVEEKPSTTPTVLPSPPPPPAPTLNPPALNAATQAKKYIMKESLLNGKGKALMMKRLRDAERAEEYVMMCDAGDEMEDMRREWLEGEVEEMDGEAGGKGKDVYFT